MLKLKPKTFIIRSLGVIDNLAEYLKGLPLDPLVEVVVKPHKLDRSLAANSLYWLWATVLAGEQGLTKEEIHEDLKKRLLLPIYERDNPDYAAMVQAVRRVHREGYRAESEALSREIIRLTSTTTATVEQFTEYLNEIEKDSANRGIFLPRPEDRYGAAMGKK